MGMIQTAVGPIYVPDGIGPPPMPPPGPVPPPVDISLAGAPGAPQVAPPAPPPPAGQLAPVDFTAPQMNDLAAANPMGGAAGAARTVGDVPFQRKQAKQQAAQNAYAASPEGQIEQATQGTLQALEGRGQALDAANEAEQAQLEETARIREQGAQNAQAERERQAKVAEERAAGLAKRQADYEKAVDAEAKYKVDDNRRWNNLSTGRKVLAGLSVIMSGLGEALQHRSGPNPAIQLIMGALKDDVDAQVRERDQLGRVADRKRNSIDMYRQQTNDLKEAGALKLAEEYKRTADQAEATAAKYAAPAAKARMMDAAAQLRVEAQKILGGAAESRFGRDLQRQGIANERSRIGVSYAQLKQGAYEFEENLKLRKNDQLIEAAKLDQMGNAAQAKALREDAARNNELAMPAPPMVKRDANGEVITDDAGQPLLDRATPLVNQDGTTWNAPDKETRRVLGEKMTAAMEVASLMDEAMAIRDRVGGESSVGNSDDYQRLKVLEARLLKLEKSGTQGMSSDEDMKVLKEALGAGDLTSFRAKAAGLEEGRARTVQELNTTMRYRGNYTGKPIDIPPPPKLGPNRTADEKKLAEIVTKPSGAGDEEIAAYQAYETARKTGKGGQEELAKLGKLKGITTAQTRQIDNLAAAASSGSPQVRTNARLVLSEAAQSGQTEAIRQYATQKLVEAGLAAPEQTGPITSTSTVQDTSYGAPPAKGK